MNELYKNNKDFREYVDKYCAKHGVTVEEAFTHDIVKAVANMTYVLRHKIYDERPKKEEEV